MDEQFFPPLDIGGVLVERVKSASVLVFMIQNDMKWNVMLILYREKGRKKIGHVKDA